MEEEATRRVEVAGKWRGGDTWRICVVTGQLAINLFFFLCEKKKKGNPAVGIITASALKYQNKILNMHLIIYMI